MRELLATGASAREVEAAIARRQAEGELPGLTPPSQSTIKNIAREMTRDDSAVWTLEESAPEEARLVLQVIRAVAIKSRGRVKHLTKREAHLAAVYLAARPGVEGLPSHERAWRAYVGARAYLAQVNRGEDLAPIHLDLADIAELEAGLEYRPGMVDPTLKEDPAD